MVCSDKILIKHNGVFVVPVFSGNRRKKNRIEFLKADSNMSRCEYLHQYKCMYAYMYKQIIKDINNKILQHTNFAITNENVVLSNSLYNVILDVIQNIPNSKISFFNAF